MNSLTVLGDHFVENNKYYSRWDIKPSNTSPFQEALLNMGMLDRLNSSISITSYSITAAGLTALVGFTSLEGPFVNFHEVKRACLRGMPPLSWHGRFADMSWKRYISRQGLLKYRRRAEGTALAQRC